MQSVRAARDGVYAGYEVYAVCEAYEALSGCLQDWKKKEADSSCMNQNMMLLVESENSQDRLTEAVPHKRVSSDTGRFCQWVRVEDSGLVQS